jgi:hypothetical protein
LRLAPRQIGPFQPVTDKLARDKRICLDYIRRMILSARAFFFGWYFSYPFAQAEVGARSK